MALRQRHLLLFIIFLTTLTTFYLYYKQPLGELVKISATKSSTASVTHEDYESRIAQRNISKLLVIASQKQDDTSWIDEHLPDWRYVRYMTDEPHGKYKVPLNKGNEAMVYLTSVKLEKAERVNKLRQDRYIIDNYHNLPDLIVFHHAHRFQWHNDDPLWDGAWILQNLQIPYIMSRPYTNLRCVWTIGCPSDLKGINQPWPTYLDPDDENLVHHLTFQYSVAFPQLFPDTPIPMHVSVPCCAQFAVPASSIRGRSRLEYVATRRWLMGTKLSNDLSGRIFEFSWHFMFGADAFSCEDAETCYCKLYGVCDLKDRVLGGDEDKVDDPDAKRGCDVDRCGNRWEMPPDFGFKDGWPDGWPEVGWHGERRTNEELDAIRKRGRGNVGKVKTKSI